MISGLSRLALFLRQQQDPVYRNAPFLLPLIWRGSGKAASSIACVVGFNIRDLGFDPAEIAAQPLNRLLLAKVSHSSKP